MKFTTYTIMILGVCGLGAVALGDILELKNGTILDGAYAGGSTNTVRFNSGAGTQVIETSQIMALTFTTTNAPGQTQAGVNAPAGAATPPAATQQAVTLPAGTTLLVRTMDSVSSRDRAGAAFTTKLETDLGADNVVALKSGTVIHGQMQGSAQAGRAVGQSSVDLRLTQIVVNGQSIPIVTSGYQEAGQRSGAKAAKGAAAGAAIGALAGSAGKGAAIGATTGALVRGDTVTITPGTLLEFKLTQPVTLPAAK